MELHFQTILFSIFFLLSTNGLHHFITSALGSIQAVETISVDKSGNGNFTSIQAAINSVPNGNSQWIRIEVHQGVYIEQVNVPKEKQFILLEGEDWGTTIIQRNAHTVVAQSSEAALPTDADAVIATAAFVVSADNFIAQKLTFQNTYDYRGSQAIAVAALIQGDKCSFQNCKFLGYQDTLCDFQGRHYFNQCWIEGSVDFIFGIAASVYEGCTLNSILVDNGPGWFTAHGKLNLTASGGFVFKNCNVTGSGNMYLGRAWNEYSTVLFYNTFMPGVVAPLGWDSRQHNVTQITYAESVCSGPGSGMGQRVPWEKQLTVPEWHGFVGRSFIDQDGWIEHYAP